MVWLASAETWLRVRILRWLGIQAALDGVVSRTATLLGQQESEIRALKAINQYLSGRISEQESWLAKQQILLGNHTEQLVEIQTAPKPHTPTDRDMDPASTWQRQRNRAEMGPAAA